MVRQNTSGDKRNRPGNSFLIKEFNPTIQRTATNNFNFGSEWKQNAKLVHRSRYQQYINISNNSLIFKNSLISSDSLISKNSFISNIS